MNPVVAAVTGESMFNELLTSLGRVPDAAACVTLGLLLASFAGLIAWQIREAGSFSVWLISKFLRVYSMLMFSQRIRGRAPVPMNGGALLLSNHRSPTDPFLLYTASIFKEGGYRTRIPEFLTAAEYCNLGGLGGWITRVAHAIPVQRNGKDMGPVKEALRRLQAGRLLAVFPEGKIHRGPGLGEFNPGVAWLALRANVPVIPAIVRNSPYCDPILRSFLIRQSADVVFAPPVDLSKWQGQKPTAAVLAEVTNHLREALLELQSGPRAAGCRGCSSGNVVGEGRCASFSQENTEMQQNQP